MRVVGHFAQGLAIDMLLYILYMPICILSSATALASGHSLAVINAGSMNNGQCYQEVMPDMWQLNINSNEVSS